MKETVSNELISHQETINAVIESGMEKEIVKASLMAVETLRKRKKIILFGNGGDYNLNEIVGTEHVKFTKIITFVEGKSSSLIIKKINNNV